MQEDSTPRKTKTEVVAQKLDELFGFERPPNLPVTCTDADLLHAVKESLVGATDQELSEILGVPARAVRHWVASKEWMAMKDHVLPQIKGLIHNQLYGIRSSVVQKLADRVRLGDPVYNNLGEPALDADGNQLYRPIRAKELAGILVQTSDVLHNIEVELGVVADDRGLIDLDDLALALADVAKKGRPEDITAQSKRLS